MKKMLLFLLLFSIHNILAPSVGIKPDVDRILKEREYNKLYNEVITSLKSFEGLMLETYSCPAGYKTIGYGHLIRPSDRFPSVITESAADSLLRADFDVSVNEVQRLAGYSQYEDPAKLLALAHFVFNMGSVKFERSTLLSMIKVGKPIKYELMKWVHYRDSDSTVVVSSNLKRMRNYEVNLFYSS